MSDAEIVVEAGNTVGEGPVWDERSATLHWVDILERRIHHLDTATGATSVTEAGTEVGALVPRARGGLVLAVRDGFATLDAPGGRPQPLAEVAADDPSIRMNDGKCDRAGRFWASTMAFEATPGAGTLYRLDPDGSVHPMVGGLTIGNGLAWTADDRTFYFVDTTTGGVDAFDFDLAAGTISNRRQVVKIPESDGQPDGMTIDAEGALWVALWGGSAVHRYLPDGSLDRVVALPAHNVTCCAFGGPELTDLYITTARHGVEEPTAADGALFRVRPGVRGVPAFAFAG